MSHIHSLVALIVVFIWGTNFVVIKVGLNEWPAFLFATLRFVLTVFPLILFLPRPKVSWTLLSSYGFVIGFGQFGLLYWAMQGHISPGLASLAIQIQVLLTIILSGFVFKETITACQLLALLVSFLGLGLIAWNTGGDVTGLGLLLICTAAMSWAIGNVIVKHAQIDSMIAFVSWSALFAIVPLTVMTLIFEGPQIIKQSLLDSTLIGWSTILWQTLANTLVGYTIWNSLLSRYRAAIVTPWALLVPVFGMSASTLLLEEPMPGWKIVSAALILSGLALNIWTSSRR